MDPEKKNPTKTHWFIKKLAWPEYVALWKKRLKWTGIVAGVVALTFVVLYVTLLIISSIQLRHAYAALLKDGRPMKKEEIIPPPAAVADNAASLYVAAASLLQTQEYRQLVMAYDPSDPWCKLRGKLRTHPKDLTPEENAKVAAVLQSDQVLTALKLIEDGARKTTCNFDAHYELGPGALLPHLGSVKMINELLDLSAHFEAAQGHTDKAWQATIASLHVCRALRNEPIMISQLVRVAQLQIAIETVQSLAETVPPSNAQAKEVIRLLADADGMTSFVRATDGERLLLGEWFFDPARSRRDIDTSICELRSSDDKKWYDEIAGVQTLKRIGTRVAYCRPVRQFDHTVYLRMMGEATKIMQSPFYAQGWPQASQSDLNVPRYAAVTRMLFPFVTGIKEKATRCSAEIRVTEVGLALKCHKIKHGEYPPDLVSLDPAVKPATLIDPFTGHTLTYRREGVGFVVYSWGDNMKDDGGRPSYWEADFKKFTEAELKAKGWGERGIFDQTWHVRE